MAKRGTEMTPEELHDRMRNKIRAQNIFSRERVILCLISLYGVEPRQFFDSPPGEKSLHLDYDLRPKPLASGVFDADAKACLDSVIKLLNGVDPKMATKIIRVIADWCDINIFYQPKFRDASFVTAGKTPEQNSEIQNPPKTFTAQPEPEEPAQHPGLNEPAPIPSPQPEYAPPPDDDDLDEFFGIAVPQEAIAAAVSHAEPATTDAVEPASTLVPEEVNDELEVDPFTGLAATKPSDDTNPFDI